MSSGIDMDYGLAVHRNSDAVKELEVLAKADERSKDWVVVPPTTATTLACFSRKCRACGQPTDVILDFGQQPRANGFVGEDYKDIRNLTDIAQEILRSKITYHLEARRCPACGLWQLGETLPASVLFSNDYPFMTGTSRVMCEHMAEYARYIAQHLIGRNNEQMVVELGCNDGTLLEALRVELPNVRLLGVDPAKNVAEVCRRKGFTVWERLFDDTCAQEIQGFHGKVAAVVGANVVCHVDRPLDLFKAVASCLKSTGLFVFEEPYLLDVLERYEFEQFYDEHPTVLSVGAVNKLASLSGLRLLDCQHTDTHGGSMRYVLGLSEARWGVSFSDSVAVAMRRELELNTSANAKVWQQACNENRHNLALRLFAATAQGGTVAAYGATSKSTVLYNWMHNVDIFSPRELISRIYDNSPGKIDKFSPGVHIPVVDARLAEKDKPDYMLLTAWNHADEIKAKCKWFKGKWITYVPKVEIS